MTENNVYKKPYVVIFGDNEAHDLTKAIWSTLSGYELELINVDHADKLESVASDAVLILMAVDGPDDDNNQWASHLSHKPRVVADIIAVCDPTSDEMRLKVLSCGYDAMFNYSFLDKTDFKRVLLSRVEKGFNRLEHRVQQEEYSRFKASLAASPDAFIVFDENNKLFFVSEHYRKAYPQTGLRLVRGIDVMDAYEMCAAEQGVREGHPLYESLKLFWLEMDGEIEFEAEGGRIWHIKAKRLPDKQGTIVTTTDITRFRTQQKELQDQSSKLANSLEKEQEAGAIQKQFINMVSHEFRTPLSIIDGNAQILARRVDSLNEEDIKKRSKTIRSAVSRLVNMMEGVLSSNMLKTGKLKLEAEQTDLASLIQELCDEHADLSSQHNIIVKTHELPETVLIDKKLMTLVISNLLSNAIKFSDDSPEIKVSGSIISDQIVLSFEDKGIGIPDNEISQIFDRFYRSATASGIPGTGIGLNLAKDLVELHNGSINVESEVGKGTKFVISIPNSI